MRNKPSYGSAIRKSKERKICRFWRLLFSLTAISLILLFFSSSAMAANIYVDNDEVDGSTHCADCNTPWDNDYDPITRNCGSGTEIVHDTISGGIAAAQDGDIVLIADGTFMGVDNKNIDFPSHTLTIGSVHGAESCIIDCENDGRAFRFNAGQGSSAVLRGITIKNSAMNAIYCAGSSPLIENCRFVNNASAGPGGAIFCRNGSSPTVSECLFSGNKAVGYEGGAVHCTQSSSPSFTKCVFQNNLADKGGAASCSFSSRAAVFTRCTFNSNYAVKKGAGNGGAIALSENGMAEINACTFVNNLSDAEGGGLSCEKSSFVVVNSIFSENKAVYGGGINCQDNSSGSVTNCTIADNKAIKAGGGIYCSVGNPNVDVTNCVIWGNLAENAENQVFRGEGCTINFDYCDIQGCGGSGPEWESAIGTDVGENIDIDPKFAFAGKDYHLQSGSPCVDSGTDVTTPGDQDLDGNDRKLNGTTDMGPYEYHPTKATIALSGDTLEFTFCDENPDPADQELKIKNAGVGTLEWTIVETCSWVNVSSLSGSSNGDVNTVVVQVPDTSSLTKDRYECLLEVEAAPEASNSPKRVKVILRKTKTHAVSAGNSIQDAVQMAQEGDAVEVEDGEYGYFSFLGKAITVGSKNGPTKCTIDFEQGEGLYFIFSEKPDSVLQGFTVTNALSETADHGGGITCIYASPTIKDCLVTGNTTESEGGGIYLDLSNTDPHQHYCNIHDCTISYNISKKAGGGI